jgi:serine/threonine protein kinase
MGLTQLTGEVLDEKYRIERELGKGGMGAVYLATHLGTGRPVAVKVITPQFMMNDEFVERFRREAKAAGRLHHPNVVNVTDFGFARIDGERIAYLVMEYLDGCTLADVLAEESQLPIDWVIDILDQTSSAIEEAHQQGIIHRDLKPDNIWLEPNRRGGYTVKVLDFGLAKLGDVESAGTDQLASLPGTFSGSLESAGRSKTIADRALRTSTFESETQVRSAEVSESASQIQLPPAENDATLIVEKQQPAVEDREDVTQILPPDNTDTATRLQPAPDTSDERTRVLDRTTAQNDARETVPADGLTRVGSILGTPVYMSPEQCRGEPLDARSDIYSLGVIGYQMLAGEPPFKGAPFELMRLHMEAAPPQLREKRKKVPKRMAKIIMSALAKQPADRPTSAAGFASAIHATSEGTGGLIRRAFALYIEHFPKFFRVTVLLNLPLILLNAALLINAILRQGGPVTTANDRNAKIAFSSQASGAFEIVLSIVVFFVTFFVNAVIVGATIRLVTQLFLSPMRPLQLGTAYRAVKKRLKPLLLTIALASIRWVLGAILIIPGILMFIYYSLVPSIVMMEGLKGRAALKRSKALVKRCWRSVLVVLCLQWAIPTVATSLIAVPVALAFKMAQTPRAPVLTGRATALFTVILNTIVVPLIATIMALLYLKARQIGGETLREVLSQFEEEDTPRTKWQMRMRERLHVSSKA